MKRTVNDHNEFGYKHPSKRGPKLNDTSPKQQGSEFNQSNPSNVHPQLMRLCHDSYDGLPDSRVPPISTSLQPQWSDPTTYGQQVLNNTSMRSIGSVAGILNINNRDININNVDGSAAHRGQLSASKNLSHMKFSPRSQQLLKAVQQLGRHENATTTSTTATTTTAATLPTTINASTSLAYLEQNMLSNMALKKAAEQLQHHHQQQQQQNDIARLQREIQLMQQGHASTSCTIPPINMPAFSIDNILRAQERQQLQQYHSFIPGGVGFASPYRQSLMDQLLINASVRQRQNTALQTGLLGTSSQSMNTFPNAINTRSIPLQVPPVDIRSVNLNNNATSSEMNDTIPLSLPVLVFNPQADQLKLSEHQILLRQQIEFFEADDLAVSTHIRGRNKSVQHGQVGIRCIHCAHIPVSRRQKGSTYFPSAKLGIYQAAQNMSSTHIQNGLCRYMPENVKLLFMYTIMNKNCESVNQSNGGGRHYWADAAGKLGLVDTEDHGIRFVRNIPLDAIITINKNTSGGKTKIE